LRWGAWCITRWGYGISIWYALNKRSIS
jgi:hypothetical protein